MGFSDDFWSDAHDVCMDLTEPMAIGTAAIYEYGGGPEVGAITGDFVESNWGYVCDLPTNLANDLGFNDSSDSSSSSE